VQEGGKVEREEERRTMDDGRKVGRREDLGKRKEKIGKRK